MCYSKKSKYGKIDCLLASSTRPLYRTSSLSGNPSLYVCAQQMFYSPRLTSHQGPSRLSSTLSAQHVNQMDNSRHKLLALSDKFIPKTGNRIFPPLANVEQSLPSQSSSLFWICTYMYTPSWQQHIPFSVQTGVLVLLCNCQRIPDRGQPT